MKAFANIVGKGVIEGSFSFPQIVLYFFKIK